MPASGGIAAFPRLQQAEIELANERSDAAAAHVVQHLRQHPGEPRGLALLGSIALRTGALVQAEQFLREAMARGHAPLDLQRDLASAINQQERLGEALDAFGYLRSRSDDPTLRATLALILDKLGRSDEALREHRALLEVKPGQPAFWTGYGHSLRAAGDASEAAAAYRRAIAIEPDFGEAWWGLANMKSKIFTDGDVAEMEAALADAVDLLNVIPLHFALGRAWHDRKVPDRAFHHFSTGNRLRAETVKYDADELSREVDTFIRTFGPRFFESTAAPPAGEPIPVFLISMPRAGSTLLEQMLDGHSQIEAVGELPYIRALLRSIMEIHTRHRPAMVPEVLTELSPGERQALGRDYLERAALHRRRDTPYFVDKMPMNWSEVIFIRQILPQARFVDIRRSAMDCCFSNYIHYFTRAHAASFDLHDIGRCYVDYVRLMDHIGAAAPGLIHRVGYESLVADPEAQLRGVFDYLGLGWEAAPLRFHESSRTVRTPSAEQVRRPLNREGIEAWRPYAHWLDPLRDALGPLADD